MSRTSSRSRVVLPAPEGPLITETPPAKSTVRSSSSRASSMTTLTPRSERPSVLPMHPSVRDAEDRPQPTGTQPLDERGEHASGERCQRQDADEAEEGSGQYV